MNREKEVSEVEEELFGISNITAKEEKANRDRLKRDLVLPWKKNSSDYKYSYKSIDLIINGEKIKIAYIESDNKEPDNDNTNDININQGSDEREVVILLHAGHSSCEEFYHWFPALMYYNFRVIAIDQPGHGKSQGIPFQLNTKYHLNEGGPCEVVTKFLEALDIKTAYVGGYDWGGGISLSLILKYPKIYKKAIILCASYTENSDSELKCISNPVLIIWEKLDHLHPWGKWCNLANKIPKKKIELLNIKNFTAKDTYSTYSIHSDKILRSVVMFLGLPDPLAIVSELKTSIKQVQDDTKGNQINANMLINLNDSETLKENFKLLIKNNEDLNQDSTIQAVKDFISLLKTKGSDAIYKALMIKDKQITDIARNLPTIHPFTLKNNPSYLVQIGIWDRVPDNLSILFNSKMIKIGQQVLGLIPCSVIRKPIDSLESNYMLYDKTQENNFSFFCYIVRIDYYNKKVIVNAKNINNGFTEVEFDLDDILLWNGGQNFYFDNNECVYLEDGLKGNYDNILVKAKLTEIAYNLSPLIGKLDFNSNDCEKIQLECIKSIRKTLNIKSFNEKVDISRHGRTDCLGKLGVNGQAQCHGFTSAISGYLLPFSELLGIELIYRGGHSFSNCDEQTVKMLYIEKHQWLQIMTKPSNRYFCVDGWYHAMYNDDKFLALPLEVALMKLTYPDCKLKLKNTIKLEI